MQVCRKAVDLHIKDSTSVHLDLPRVKLTKLYEGQEKLQEKLENTLKEHEELKERTMKIEEKLNYTVHLLSTVMKT